MSHPGIPLGALIARMDHDRNRLSDMLFGPYSSIFLHHPRKKFRNLLSVMENDTGSIFELIEDDVKVDEVRGAHREPALISFPFFS